MWKRYEVSLIIIILLLCGPNFVSDSIGENFVLFAPEKFIRETAKPEKIVKTFSATNVAGRHTLIVQNGEGEGCGVASAVISLNGQRVVEPGGFNKNVDWISKPVLLEEQNEISVEIRSKPSTWIVVTIIERNWFYEHEFKEDESLRVRPHHIVILDLQPGDGFESIKHSIPYEYTEEGDYTFCIDPDDEYLTAMSLVNESGDEVLSINRDDGCVHLHLPAGRYTKHVYHHETAVPDSGTVASIYQPASEYASSPQRQSNNMEQTASLLPEWPIYGALQVVGGEHDGKYLTAHPKWRSDSCYPGSFIPEVIPLDSTTTSSFNNLEHLFSFEKQEDPDYYGSHYFHSYHSDGNNTWFTYNLFSCYPIPCKDNYKLCIDSQNQVSGHVVMPFFWDGSEPKELGIISVEDKETTFSIWMDDTYAIPSTGLYAPQESSYLYFTYFAKESTYPTVFKTLPTMRFYTDGTQVGSLQEGEVAYFEGENCTGRAFVVNGSFEDSAPVTLDSITSIKFGFNTTIQFFGETNYEQLIKTMGADSGSIKPPLNGADIKSVKLFNSKNILLSSKKCEYCNLASVDLSKLSLKDFDLSYAILYGTNMNYSNLEGANLCSAFLNGDIQSRGNAAELSGAYLKNVNLAYANMIGVIFTNANFYSETGLVCVPQNCEPTSYCASAVHATMNSTNFSNAYLSGVDMSNSDAYSANFSNAMLFGVRFNNAKLDRDSKTTRTDFTGAFIGGADFTNATVVGADFSSAYVDFTKDGHCMFVKLNGSHTTFADYWRVGGFGYPICVMTAYTNATKPPGTDKTNACPDGGNGPCQDENWTDPVDKSLQATSFCGDPDAVCDDPDSHW